MRLLRNTAVWILTAGIVIAGSVLSSRSLAGDVLVNGNLETGVAPAGWSINTFLSDDPDTAIPNAVEHNDGANNPPVQGLGLLIHPQVGDQGIYAGQDKKINFVLEQTFNAAIAGRTYTFKGDAFLQDGYSGIVENLDPLNPIGDYNEDFAVNAADYTRWRDNLGTDIALPHEGPTPGMVTAEDYTEWKSKFGQHGHPAGPSPTQTTYEIEFLDNNDALIGTTTKYDLRSDPTTLGWRTSDSVSALAPAGVRKVRVRVAALDMQDNCCAHGQDVMFDNFSLMDGVVTLNRLTNGNLNTPGDPVGWTLVEGPTVDQGMGPVTADSAAFIGFANRKVASTTPNPTPPPDFTSVATGSQGLWLRPFVNATQFEPDIPSVDAVMSQIVAGTPGAQYDFSAWSAWEPGYSGGLNNTSTVTFIKIEFLNGTDVIGTQMLNLKDAGQINDDAGGVEYDDWRQFTVSGTAPALTTNVRVSLGATGMFDIALGISESAFFDEMSLIETLPGAGSLAAVPEPASVVLLGIAVGLLSVGRRRTC